MLSGPSGWCGDVVRERFPSRTRMFTSIFMYIHVLLFFLNSFLRCCLFCVRAVFFPRLPPSSRLLLSILLSSYVDEIRWFLLGEASVHPSAAPSRARPTASNQVINHPANSHPPSITRCFLSPLLLFSMCVPVHAHSILWPHRRAHSNCRAACLGQRSLGGPWPALRGWQRNISERFGGCAEKLGAAPKITECAGGAGGINPKRRSGFSKKQSQRVCANEPKTKWGKSRR